MLLIEQTRVSLDTPHRERSKLRQRTMATTPNKDKPYVQIPLRSNTNHHFTGRTVAVHIETCYVLFSNLVKVVLKKEEKDATTAHEQINKVLSKINHTQYIVIDNDVFVSSNALNILLTEHKDTWGAFVDDGFAQLLEDIKLLRKQGKSSVTPEVKVKKETSTEQTLLYIPLEYGLLLDARERNIAENEKTLRARHELLATREAVISAREKTMNEGERFFKQRETKLVKKIFQYKEDRDMLDSKSNALDQKEKELDERSNDLQQFMDQTLALAKQFSGGGGSSSSKKKTPSKVHFNLPSSSKRSYSVSPSLTSKDSAVKALLMVKKVCSVFCVLLLLLLFVSKYLVDYVILLRQ